MPLDPLIADVPYASENPPPTETPSNVFHTEGPELEQGGPAEKPPLQIAPGTPTLDEIKEYHRLNGTVNPIIDLSAEDIAKLAINDPENFQLSKAMIELRPQWNKEIVNKAADAYNLLERRGWKPPKDLGFSQLPKMVKETVAGAADWLGAVAKGSFGVPASLAMEKIDELSGISPAIDIRRRQELQQGVSEAAAATEASVTGLAFLGEKAWNKLFGKKPELKNQQEKLESLKAFLIPHLAHETISKGGGLVQYSPEIQAEQAQAGLAIRPEEVNKKIAGDPVGFLAFGKGLEGVAGLVGVTKPVATAVSKIPGLKKAAAAVAPEKIAGGAIELAGGAVKGTAKVAEVVAPVAVPVIGAVAGGDVLSNLGHAAAGAITGGLTAIRGVKPVQAAARAVQKGGEAIKTFGREVAGKELPTGATSQLARDVFQSLPSAAGETAKGATLDLGLAALTATTPEDQQGLQLGTILGAAQGLRRTGAWVVSGQKIAPRAWGSKGAVGTSGDLPIFDRMHNAAYSSASPAVREHMNAVRQFLKGIGGDTEAFMANPENVRTAADGRVVNTDIEKALIDSGYDAATAEDWAKQNGMFTKEFAVPGKPGQTKRVIIVADADAAPHEAKHAFQDVIGEQANTVIDKVIRDTYSDQWEQLGQSYAEQLLGRRLNVGESWRNVVLDASGAGNEAANLKISMEAANKFAADNGALPKPGDIAEPPPLDPGQWKTILSADDAGAAADRYISREIAAETFDSIFKNLGAALQEKTGLVPWLAKVVAATTEALGGDSLRGRGTTLGFPLQEPVVQAIKGQVREFVPEIKPKAPGGISPTPRAGAPAPLPSGSPVPFTPEDRAVAAEETRKISEGASDTPKAGGTRSDKELLGEIAAAQAGGDAVKINYLSAPDEPAAAISSNRNVRRQLIEMFRTMPAAARKLWEKNFFPERVRRTAKGKIQVGGWAPEVFAANAHKTAEILSQLDPALSPYEIDRVNKTFTEAGWKQLFEDTQKFVRNQMAGQTGSGQSLVVPRQITEAGFYKPPETAGAGVLDQRNADFISAMFGMKLPETTRVTGGKTPLNIAGQVISQATIPGRVEAPVRARPEGGVYPEPFEGFAISEVNPWRAEFELAVQSAGKTLPSTIEAFQWLNLDNIKEVQHTPEQPQFRGNTLTLQAGFQPKPNDPRAIRSPAVRDDTGKVFEGTWHGDAIGNASMMGSRTRYDDFEHGYTTNTPGEFLSREDALKRATELNQVSKEFSDTREGLEAFEFGKARQFQPQPAKEIEVEGPDGNKYKVRFDGYYDLTALGKGFVPAITALEDLPGSLTKLSSGMGKSLTDAGYKLPELPAPEGEVTQFAPRRRTDDYETLNKQFAQEHPNNAGMRFVEGFEKAYRKDPELKSLMEGVYFQRLSKDNFPDAFYDQAKNIADSFGKPTNNAETDLQNYLADTYPDLVDEINLSQDYFQSLLLTPEKELQQIPAIVEARQNFAFGKIVQEGFDAREAERFLNDWRDEGYSEVASKNPALAKWIDDNLRSGSAQQAAQFQPKASEEEGVRRVVSAPGLEHGGITEPILSFVEPGEFRSTLNRYRDWLMDVKGLTKEEAETRLRGILQFQPRKEGEEVRVGIPSFRATGGNRPSGAAPMMMFKDTGDETRYFKFLQEVKGMTEEQAANEILRLSQFQPRRKTPEEDNIAKIGDESFAIFSPRSRKEEKDQIGPVPRPAIDREERRIRGLTQEEQQTPETAFSPRKREKEDDLRILPTSFGAASKAWILPNGKVEQLGAEWHHQWLDEHPEIQAKYGLKVPAFEGTDTEGVREAALKKGFSRVNLENGNLIVEAREKDWRSVRPIVEDMIERNLDDIDKFRVHLLNDAVDKVTKSLSEKLFDADTDKEKLDRVYNTLSERPQTELETKFQPKTTKEEDLTGTKIVPPTASPMEQALVRALDAWAENQKKQSKKDAEEWLRTHGALPPEGEVAFQPSTEVRNVAKKYSEEEGIDYKPLGAPLAVKEGLAKRIADFYDTAKHDPNDPEVVKSYDALGEETVKQYHAIEDAGYTIEPWKKAGEPYASSAEMLKDVQENKHLWYLPTTGNFQDAGNNLMLRPSGVEGVSYNDLFRAVHDFFGHAQEGYQFGPRGELNAWNAHSEMYSPEAQGALAAETLAQNSWVNFGKHMRDEAGNIPKLGEAGYKPLPERPFAEQKNIVIPKDLISEAKQSAQFQPRDDQEQLFGGKEYISPANFTRAELLDRHPEAIVPKNSNEKIASDITGSPLYRKSDDPVQAFADKLAAFAKTYADNPVYQLGLKWYSDFVPALKKQFGKDAPMMAELLAASSPNETPTQNFFYAADALQGFRSGRFDKIIDKFNQGFDLMKDDKWLGWYNKELKAGNIPDAPATPTPEAFMAHWIFKHGLKPKQSNGALYGFHGKAILEVMARKWINENKGPKVANFVQNLLGTGHEATIDVWADRTMRRLGYADTKDRWRILPKNAEGVSDADFEFAQQAFREAAKQLGIKPDALQGGLWFAEKQLWADNGWGRLDLGSYMKEMENLPLIQQSIKQRLKTTELKKKAVPMEQTGLQFQPMNKYRIGPYGRTDTVVEAENTEKAFRKYERERGVRKGSIQSKVLTVRPVTPETDIEVKPRNVR